MPLSKQAKALYEAALRRKGLQPGKAVRRDPRTFIGPIEMEGRRLPIRLPRWSQDLHGDVTDYKEVMTPSRTYWEGRGRFQDLEDELSSAIDAGVWERKNPTARGYYRYYNDGDIPSFIRDDWEGPGMSYGDPTYAYRYPQFEPKYPQGTRRVRDGRELTRLGKMEPEARADEMIENDYKDYLRRVYSRWPTREDALREIPFDHAQYLDEFYPMK